MLYKNRKFKQIAIAISFCMLLFADNLVAQDRLYLVGLKDPILVKIIEVKSKEVIYKNWPLLGENDVIYESKKNIVKIVFENGNYVFFQGKSIKKENYLKAGTAALKIKPLSLMNSILRLSFEQSLAPKISIEAEVGILLGPNTSVLAIAFDQYGSLINAKGSLLNLGIKVMDFAGSNRIGRNSKVLKGSYFKPEFVFINHTNEIDFTYSSDFGPYNPEITKFKYVGFAAIANIGKQWVINDNLILDLYTGIGIGTKFMQQVSSNASINYQKLHVEETGAYGFITFTKNPGQISACFQSGFKIGVLIGKEKQKN